MPTARLLLIALIAAPLLALAELAPAFIIAALLYLLLVGGLALLDLALMDRPGAFEIERTHDQRLSLGADNPVTIGVRHRGLRDTSINLRDEPPDEWLVTSSGTPDATRVQTVARQGPPMFAFALPARTSHSAQYTVKPLRRGDYRFEDVTLRWLGPLGLMRWQHRFPLTQPVQVYPNVLEVRKYDLLLHRNRLEDIGLRVSRRYGEGREFERMREYQPDDDIRHISWKATARHHKPITMEYESERSQTIFVAFDAGRMMNAPVGEMTRLDYVINAVLLFSYVVLGKGDRVGMMTFADSVTNYIEPRAGRSQFYRMLDLLYRVETQPVEPDFSRALGYLKLKQRRRALVVVFSDLTGGLSMQQLASGVIGLRPPHLPLVVTISDPVLKELATAVPAGEANVYERVAAQRMLDDRRMALQRMEMQGALTLDVPATQLSSSVINKYLEIKGRGIL
ncbi:MAG: DUF58 domain-containing protein [Chloroflexi bacterium]|nr:DUF58 domain-containing protein [Chloroflexota bacterium]MCL5273912.1 DUF58 domain-containing protein [Chloroflexota bacterium]